MTMYEILKDKGIEMNAHHPAKDGNPRWGLIRKEVIIYSPSEWDKKVNYSTIGLEVDTVEKTIKLEHIKGTMPYVGNLIYALLGDIDIRRMIREYQETEERRLFKVWTKHGMSGSRDIMITEAEKIGGFAVTKTRKVIHVSMNNKVNEGYGKEVAIGDLVEVIHYMGMELPKTVKELRKKGGVKYLKPRLVEETKDFDTNVSKIL